MPREKMTSFGVPVDASIVDYIERIDDLPKINTTYSCSGIEKDHKEKSGRPYLVVATGCYVGEDLKSSPRYPHETHRISLKVMRAAIQAGWYTDYTTTSLKGTNGISGIYLSTKPSVPRYSRILAGNVTGNPVKTKERRNQARNDIEYEKREYFDTNLSDTEIEYKWKKLCEELEWEMINRRSFRP
jgi:hypothetical protein